MSSVLFFVVDGHYNVVEANEAFRAKYGSVSSLLPDDALQPVHRDQLNAWCACVRRVLKHGKSIVSSSESVEGRNLLEVFEPLTSGEQPSVACMIHGAPAPVPSGDTLNDKIFKHLLEEIPANIFWFDPDGLWLGANEHQLKIIPGDWTIEELVGRTVEETIGEHGGAVVKDTIEQVKSRGKTMVFEELDIAQTHWLSYKIPIFSNEGEFMSMLGVSFDVTEHVEERKAHAKAREEAENALKVREVLLENMQHDIRTPFNGIVGLSSYLESQENDPAKKDLLQLIVQSAQSLVAYCNNIIAYTMSRDHAHQVNLAPMGLRDSVNGLIQASRVTAVHKSIELHCGIAETLPDTVITDVFRFQSIILNLVNNAIKFTHRGSVTLTLDRQRCDQLCITCEDTGIGIEEERQAVIFEPFVKRLPSHVSNDEQGSGLGLSIVKRYIDDLGGEISLESTLEIGTCFKVVLPLWQDLSLAQKSLADRASS